MSFVHLHTHSHYSIGRAIPSVRNLVRRAAELEMPALALTDNNSIAGLHELVQSCREFNVKPIIGCELDVLPSDHAVFQGRTHRLVLLVENETGYRNLVELISLAHEHPPDLPSHARFAEFEKRTAGLIVLTGSPRGELYHWLREGNTAATKTYLNRLAAAAPGRLFFEVIEYPHPRIRKIMDYVFDLSRFLGVPSVATQNVHFLDPPDVMAYCALTQFPRFLNPQWPPPDQEMPTRHFTTAAAMHKRFGFTPEIVEQTLAIAERCSFCFPRNRSLIPVPDFDRGQDAASMLWDMAIRGVASRYGGLTEPIKDRLNVEFGDIRALNRQGIDLAEQFLLLREITSFLRERGLCRGIGRGEWVTSVVAYALGIVEVDPLAYKLEYRPLRSKPFQYPVFEIEVSTRGAQAILEWLRKKFGAGAVAAVGRRVDWKRSDLFHRLCRWVGLPAVGLRRFPPEKAAPAPPEPERYDETSDLEAPRFSEVADDDVELAADNATGPVSWMRDEDIPRQKSFRQHKTLAEITYALHPCPRGFEAQRGQYAVSKEAIGTIIPLVPTPSGLSVTQADPEMLDHLQMPRLQFSSLSLLNTLEFAQDSVRREDNPDFLLSEIPLNDEPTFRILGLGLTNGIPPFQSITAKSLLRAERPSSIADLLEAHSHARKRRQGEPRPDPVESLPDCLLGYWCAYLKVHHPISFLVSVLTHTAQFQHAAAGQRPRFQILLREARKMGIEVFGPDINFSLAVFSQERRGIRTGLMAIQGLGEHTYREIETVRNSSAFTSLADFCQRTDPRSVNQTQVANLIRAGAFDSLEPNRNRLLLDFERALKNARLHSPRYAENPGYQQLQLFDPSVFEEGETGRWDQPFENVPMPSPAEIIRFEREALGYSISFDLLDHYREVISAMRVISPFDLTPKLEGKRVFVAGFVDHAEREGPLIDGETEIVLDLEGKVVKVPPAAAGAFSQAQNAHGAALIEGVVRKHTGAECFLVARNFQLLDEVWRKAREAKFLRLRLADRDAKTLGRVRTILKAHPGETLVEVEGKPSGSWWSSRGIENAGVFFCPPLYYALSEIIPEKDIRALDSNRRIVNM